MLHYLIRISRTKLAFCKFEGLIQNLQFQGKKIIDLLLIMLQYSLFFFVMVCIMNCTEQNMVFHWKEVHLTRELQILFGC